MRLPWAQAPLTAIPNSTACLKAKHTARRDRKDLIVDEIIQETENQTVKSIHRNCSVEQAMIDRVEDWLVLISPFENASNHQPHLTEGKMEAWSTTVVLRLSDQERINPRITDLSYVYWEKMVPQTFGVTRCTSLAFQQYNRTFLTAEFKVSKPEWQSKTTACMYLTHLITRLVVTQPWDNRTEWYNKLHVTARRVPGYVSPAPCTSMK